MSLSEFAGRTLVLATKHQKESVMQPLLERALGVRVVVPPDFDTDRFGMFAGSIERKGTQREAARAKARAALTHTGADLVVVSEGAFGPDPQVPFVQSGSELVLLIDTKYKLEVAGVARSKHARVRGQLVRSAEEAAKLATDWGFSEWGVVVKRSQNDRRYVTKDIPDVATLGQIVRHRLRYPWQRQVWLETDLRAHRNPGRLQDIAAATEVLLANLASRCPECTAPGFVVTSIERGALCAACGLPTDHVRSETRTCQRCQHTLETLLVTEEGVSPEWCARCNP